MIIMAPIRQLNMANYCGPSTSKGICSAVTKLHDLDDATSEEENIYIRKVQELANEKLELFARKEKELCEEIDETNSSKKRPRMSLDEDHVNTMLIKNVPNIVNRKGVLPVVDNEVTRRLKEYIENGMNGSDINLVIQKQLFLSDTKQNQNRLNMPMKQVVTHKFLREDEKLYLALHKDNEIEVPLVGPKLRMYEKLMGFKAWSMSSTKNYVLKTCWFNFWQENKDDLQIGELIQVWSFRIQDQLCFAIACVNKPVANMNVDEEEGPSVEV